MIILGEVRRDQVRQCEVGRVLAGSGDAWRGTDRQCAVWHGDNSWYGVVRYGVVMSGQARLGLVGSGKVW